MVGVLWTGLWRGGSLRPGLQCRAQVHVRNGLGILRGGAARYVAQYGDRYVLVGIAHEVCAIAGRRSAVTDIAESPVLADDESEGVLLWASVVEPARFLLLAHERKISHFRRDEVLVPLEQIAHGRQQPSVAMNVFKRHVHLKLTAASLGIGNCPVPH